MRILLTVMLLALALQSLPAGAAERLEIEPCTYPDDDAAAAAWKPVDGSGPAALAAEKTPDGKPALAFRCDMPQVEQRAYWDRTVPLDLGRFGRISFWVKATGDLTAIGSCSLYFNAGGGWYGTSFGLPADGWKQVVLDKAQFNIEDKPEGWQNVRAIRLAFWKGQAKQATVLFGGLEAQASDIAIVLNARAGKEAETFAEGMAKSLARAGIDAGTLDDAAVEKGMLAGKRVAIYPQNPKPSDKELDAVEAFVKGGGHVIVCYALHPRLAALLGLQDQGYLGGQYPGQFSSMRFLPGGPAGLPKEALQASWNIERVKPAGNGARILAEWFDKDGKDTGFPAITLNDAGAYVSHVLLPDDPDSKDRILRAIIGHFDPDVWEQAAGNALRLAGQLSRWQTFAAAEAGIRETAAGAGKAGAVAPLLAEARRAYDDAGRRREAKQYPEALDAASLARARLLDAYSRALPSRAGEMRAVWCHSAYGVAGMTWDEAIRRLKAAGFNAIVPNMLWGGVADYKSDVLPVRDRVAREGDQIALCVAAAHKYGVEVHVWKVNWNLSGAPQEFVERMRAEGRLQRTDAGEEHLWLCPSNPANFQLERDAMLEVARKYDVDGIHFDYIRYPAQFSCYCDGCRQRFEESAGVKVATWPKDVLKGGPQFAAYQEFRRSNITRLVKAVSEEAHRIKPWIKVSAAVFSDWPFCREHVGQDWGRWVQEGWLDFVCPMDYTDSNAAFRSRVQVQREAVGAHCPLVPGIGASAPGLPLDQVMDQVQIARAEGADGFIIFNYDGRVAADYVPAMGRSLTAGTALPPHDAPPVAWQVLQDGKPLAGPAAAGRPIHVEGSLGATDRLRKKPDAVDVAFSVATLDGKPVQAIGKGGKATADLQLAKGTYRLIAAGEMRFAGRRQAFTVRGPVVVVGD